MANQDPLRELFSAIAGRRWDLITVAARSLATQEDRKGRHALARDLYRALEAADQVAQPMLPSGGALAQLGSSQVSVADVVLTGVATRELQQLLSEHRKAGSLARQGLRPRRKLLFFGPPGCGKSFTARALGHDLELPVALVRFEQLIGSWLGQTAQRLQEVFTFARTVPSVVVLDEIDALTRSRGRPNDVGEMDRTLISMLQNLEHDEPAGLLVASTNVPEALDRALWRRFDLVIEFPRPARAVLERFARGRAAKRQVPLNGNLRKASAGWSSYADAERFLDDLVRRRVLESE